MVINWNWTGNIEIERPTNMLEQAMKSNSGWKCVDRIYDGVSEDGNDPAKRNETGRRKKKCEPKIKKLAVRCGVHSAHISFDCLLCMRYDDTMRSIRLPISVLLLLLLFVFSITYWHRFFILAAVWRWWYIKLNINVFIRRIRALSIFTNWMATQNMPFCDSNECIFCSLSLSLFPFLPCERNQIQDKSHTTDHHRMWHPVAHKTGIH